MTPTEEKEAVDKINETFTFNSNRADRRRKPLKPRVSIYDYIIVPSNILTSPSHKYNKIRKENAPSKQQRKRSIAEARKARAADRSQIS